MDSKTNAADDIAKSNVESDETALRPMNSIETTKPERNPHSDIIDTVNAAATGAGSKLKQDDDSKRSSASIVANSTLSNGKDDITTQLNPEAGPSLLKSNEKEEDEEEFVAGPSVTIQTVSSEFDVKNDPQSTPTNAVDMAVKNYSFDKGESKEVENSIIENQQDSMENVDVKTQSESDNLPVPLKDEDTPVTTTTESVTMNIESLAAGVIDDEKDIIGRRYPKRAREPTWEVKELEEAKQKEEQEKLNAVKKKRKQKEEAEAAEKAAAAIFQPGPMPDANVGRYVEQYKLLGHTTGQLYPLNGKIVQFRPAEGRIPPRYAIQWEQPSVSKKSLADDEAENNIQYESIIQEDEWVAEDLKAFEESVEKGTSPIMTYSAYKSTVQSYYPASLKLAVENVKERYQQVVERDLADSNLLPTLVMMAAFEEALQTSLQAQQQREEESVAASSSGMNKKSTSGPHPPLYYSSNPSSYLQPPTAGNDFSGNQQPKAQMTPSSLAQRVRQGCQWAWAYVQANQPSSQLLDAPVAKRAAEDFLATAKSDSQTPSNDAIVAATIAASYSNGDGTSVAQRRTLRAVRMAPAPSSYLSEDRSTRTRSSGMPPGVQEPNPVQKGGRVALWWLKALQDGSIEEGEGEEDGIVDSGENTETNNFGNAMGALDNTKANIEFKRGSKKLPPNKEEVVEIASESFGDDEDEEDGDDVKDDDDDDYSAVEDEHDQDEPLENVERERGKLSPVPPPTSDEGEVQDEEVDEEDAEMEEEVDEDHLIIWANPYLQSSFPAFLEYLSRPKSVSMEDVQKAMDEITLRIRHNRRSAEFGLPVQKLASFDQVVLNFENENPLDKGKVVLKCVSGESITELQRLDANAFGRCKFEIDVIGEEEKAVQIQRKEDFLQKEIEFKERKAWDRWRFRGIQEGYAIWPSWQEAAEGWVKQNAVEQEAVAANRAIQQAVPNSSTDPISSDEALAKSLEENDDIIGGRRRTGRRAAAAGNDGVFYGNQSQLSQRQLMDALFRLVKSNTFQTLMRLQATVSDDSSDPIRRCRIALGKMIWKRNLIAKKVVTTDDSDREPNERITRGETLVVFKNSIIGNGVDTDASKSSIEIKDLLDYILQLQETEIKLRNLVLRQLADVPVAVIATAADERNGSLESMDNNDFDDPSAIQWNNTAHPLINKSIFRPATQSTLADDATNCFWYRITGFSDPIKSEAEDAEEDAMERRMRFRAEPDERVGQEMRGLEVQLLTDAQVHAGVKAAEMQRQQESKSFKSNPYSRVTGDKITLIPVDDGDEDMQQHFPEIRGRIVGNDCIVDPDEDDSDVEYRILILPDTENGQTKNAFWAVLDVRADDSSYVCQPEGHTTWYSIENQDLHQDSEAYHECEKILNWLCNQSRAAPFLQPVDPVALGIPSYPEIVKHPMDISTITDKLENGHYSSVPPGQSYGQSPACRMLNGPFRKDIELMFDNAILFNPPDDWIHQAAATLKKNAIKKIESVSAASERSFRNAGGRQKRSVYVDEDSDQDMYEYESDQDDDYGGKRSRKRKRESRAGSVKEEASTKPMEHTIRLQYCLKDGNDLRGPFSSLPINTDANTYSMPAGWTCRKRITEISSLIEQPFDADNQQTKEQQDEELSPNLQRKKELQKEMADLLALQKVVGENEAAGLRRSSRAHEPSERSGSNNSPSKVEGLEYVEINENIHANGSLSDESMMDSLPSSRLDVEILQEKRHEEYYARLYQKYEKELLPTEQYGAYVNGSFPPYLGRAIPSENWHRLSWEIRSPFAVSAIRWVIRGLIYSGHLTAIEPMTSDPSSGIVIKNDVYYWDARLQPFEVLDVRELQRRKRADNAAESESEDDFEMSEYEKLRAERVARNQERLKALGLA